MEQVRKEWYGRTICDTLQTIAKKNSTTRAFRTLVIVDGLLRLVQGTTQYGGLRLHASSQQVTIQLFILLLDPGLVFPGCV